MSQFLFTRYSQGQIYTYIGDVLLAVNQFTPLAAIDDYLFTITFLNIFYENYCFIYSQEAIVSQLFTRYSQGQIYTYIGDILLAVNPFTPLTIYNEEVSKTMVNSHL